MKTHLKLIFALLTAAMLLPAGVQARKKGPVQIKVMSYNIRFGSAKDGDNAWENRKPGTPRMLEDQAPDIFGVQEALDYQIGYILENCPQYKSYGIGREDGVSQGEHMSIFWNKKRIKLLKCGTFWLSETPEEPSKGWDAACRRTATWTLMKDRQSGKKFYYVNTHLDHRGWEARKNGLALIVERIAAMNPKGYPMILTGDFNMRPQRPEFEDLKKVMKDARVTARTTDTGYTFSGWKINPSSESVIDYVWYSGFSDCPEYHVVRKEYGVPFVSDHFPIMATLVF